MQMFKKPKDVRYVDMAIEIDNEFYTEDVDYNKMYYYMWLLAYMLACKAKYFNTKEDYEEFASYLAYSTYQRMIDKDKVPIKSVLNYMKSIMSWRKGAFNEQKHQEIINPDYEESWDNINYEQNYIAVLESSNHEKLVEWVIDVLKSTPTVIKKNIPRVYKHDKETYSNIYMSCLLTMINKFTLSNQSNEYLKNKLELNPMFNEVKYYKKHLDENIILWHLPESMVTVVMVVINKVNKYLVNEIKGLSSDIQISENEFSAIVSSGLESGNTNETDY